MNEARVLEIVRQFPENGMKLMLHTSGNVENLLTLGHFAAIDRLHFGKMTVDPTVYVAEDYRHVASDVVLSVPWRPGGKREVAADPAGGVLHRALPVGTTGAAGRPDDGRRRPAAVYP